MFSRIETFDQDLHCALDFFKQLKFDECIIKFQECLEEAKKDDVIKVQLFCYYGLAEVTLFQNKLMQSKKYFQSAQEAIEQLEKRSILLVNEFRLWSNRLDALREKIEEAELLIFEPNSGSDWMLESSGQPSNDIFSSTSTVKSKIEEKEEEHFAQRFSTKEIKICGKIEGSKKLRSSSKDDPILTHVDDINRTRIGYANRQNDTTQSVYSSQDPMRESLDLIRKQPVGINEIKSIFQKALYDFYREKNKIQHLFKETHINLEDLCFNLFMWLRSLNQTMDRGKAIIRNAGILDYEEFKEINYKITPENLFRVEQPIKKYTKCFMGYNSQGDLVHEFLPYTPSQNPINRILIRGEAGIGKTTLCHYLAYQWALGKLWQEERGPKFEWVIWIPLRELSDYAQRMQQESSIVGFLSEKLRLNENIIKRALNKSEKTLFILDGYDEVNYLPKPSLNDAGHPVWPLVNLLKNASQWIMTSRTNCKQNYITVDREIELIKLTNENIRAYIRNYYQGKEEVQEKGEQLIAYLESNPIAWHIAHIPIQLEYMCFAWQYEQHVQMINASNITLTALYTRLNQHLFHYYLTEQFQGRKRYSGVHHFGQQPGSLKRKISAIAAVALRGLVNQEMFISVELLNKTFANFGYGLDEIQEMAEIGLLSKVGDTISAQQEYSFQHLTFQEYYAARHIVEAFIGSTQWSLADLSFDRRHKTRYGTVNDFIKLHKYDARYEIVWWFVAGLLSECGQESIKHFFDAFNQPPYDVLGMNRTILMVRLLEECINQQGQVGLPVNDYNSLLVETTQYVKHIASMGMLEGFGKWKSSLARRLVLCPRLVQKDKLLFSVKSKKFFSFEVMEFYRALGENNLIFEGDVIDHVILILQGKLTKVDQRQNACYFLGFQSNVENARKALINSLRNDKSISVRKKAAAALRLHMHHDEVRQLLIDALLHDKCSPIRAIAASVLKSAAYRDDVREALLKSLCQDANKLDSDPQLSVRHACGCFNPNSVPYLSVRIKAANALKTQTRLHPTEVAVLLNVLLNTSYIDKEKINIAKKVAEVISSQTHLEVKIIERLINALRDRRFLCRIDYIILALQYQMHLEDVRKAVVAFFFKDENTGVHDYSTFSMFKSQACNEEVKESTLDTLFSMLKSQVHHEDVREAALNVLLNGKSTFLRKSAVLILRSQTHFENVREVILNILLNDEGEVRENAAIILASQAHHEDIRKAYLNIVLDNTANVTVKKHAIYALQSQVYLENIKSALLKELVGVGREYDLRCAAALALQSQAHCENVRRALVDALQYGKIKSAAKALQSKIHEEDVKQVFLKLLLSKANIHNLDNFKSSIIDALYFLTSHTDVRKALLKVLRRVTENDNNYVIAMKIAEILRTELHHRKVFRALLNVYHNEVGEVSRRRWSQFLTGIPLSISLLLKCYKRSSEELRKTISELIINRCVDQMLPFCLDVKVNTGRLSLFVVDPFFDLTEEEAMPFVKALRQFSKRVGIPLDPTHLDKPGSLYKPSFWSAAENNNGSSETSFSSSSTVGSENPKIGSEQSNFHCRIM